MSKVSRAYVRRQAGIIANLSKAASKAAKKAVEADGEWDDKASAVAAAGATFAGMSAALAVSYYRSIRKTSGRLPKYEPTAASGYNADAVYAATISILESVRDGTATRTAGELAGNVLDREVKNASDRTIRHNVRRDPAKPRYAIVPNGDACAFCQMRAAAGYTYGDEDAVESHDHCTCTATPVFGGATVEGYDPSEYAAKYDEARDALASGDVPDELKERIEAQKEAKGRDFDKTNAILMVMRHQQGIS